MKTSDFNFELPEHLIAQTPLEQRDQSRLLVLDRKTGEISHQHFYNLIDSLIPGDCLVLNNTRVIPARLFGIKEGTGAAIETVLLKDLGNRRWECMTRPGKKTKPGAKIIYGDGLLTARVVSAAEDGNKILEFEYDGVFLELLEKLGTMPLPPYIKEKLNDPERYQTVYSKEPGSAAAPTAGLHFTKEMLKQLEEKGIFLAYITLHVGLGTFRPVKVEDITHHFMHSEYYDVSRESADIMNEARRHGGRIISVGTTVCRTLETVADTSGIMKECSGWTNIFIYPGYQFKIIDGLITNFHLPESTLVMLVSAFAGKENIMNAYHEAINLEYRFFSFGDAMFIR